MSSTRRSSDGVFHQERFCSSPEFQTDGINGLAAAKRIAIVTDRSVREILWWLQWCSLSPGGIQQIRDQLCSEFKDRITTPTLRKVFARKNKRPSPEELRAICNEVGVYQWTDISQYFSSLNESDGFDRRACPEGKPSPHEQAAQKLEDTRQAAAEKLCRHLIMCCLDPSQDVSVSPWYFDNLFGALTALRRQSIKAAQTRLADTAISRSINETLDFCLSRRRMVLLEGPAGLGRTETTKAWRDAHAGIARYVEVPSSSDDRSFYASIALQLGVARGTSYKAQEIKIRVEEMLAGSDLMLLLDEAHYLWPQYLRPRKTPDRLLWIKSVFDAGTPIALVAHTDFSRWQAHCVKQTLWSDEQFERRLNRKVSLPTEHSRDDMLKIAKAKFPQGDCRSWKLLSAYALGTEKKQASGITEALESARYRAEQDGRAEPTFENIEAALVEEHGFLKARCDNAATLQASCPNHANSVKQFSRNNKINSNQYSRIS